MAFAVVLWADKEKVSDGFVDVVTHGAMWGCASVDSVKVNVKGDMMSTEIHVEAY